MKQHAATLRAPNLSFFDCCFKYNISHILYVTAHTRRFGGYFWRTHRSHCLGQPLACLPPTGARPHALGDLVKILAAFDIQCVRP